MRTLGHIVTSAGIGLFTYHRYKSKGAGLASFLVGFLIDIDHIVDYVKAHGWKPKWSVFNEAKHEHYSGKLYVPLHSYELIALFFMLCRRPEKHPYRVGVTLSVLTHLLLDQKCNPSRKPLTYFLAHRIHKRFNARDLLKAR
jgi:membrane-bound metal-dependent hydrolase YbcI (DUF457 family)